MIRFYYSRHMQLYVKSRDDEEGKFLLSPFPTLCQVLDRLSCIEALFDKRVAVVDALNSI